MEQPRQETPDPLRYRPRSRSLNGPWEFAVDDEAAIRPRREPGRSRPNAPEFRATITVPYCPQSELSGVEYTGHHPVLWYRRAFTLSDEEASGRVFLHFGAVDFACEVWVNGAYLGSHRGGYTPFRFEITHVADRGENRVLLRVEDHLDKSQPRGKQSWQAPFVCWYGECSGIWQSVWLEFAPNQGIDHVRMTATTLPTPHGSSPHTPPTYTGGTTGRVRFELRPFSPRPASVEVNVLRNEHVVASAEHAATYPLTMFDIDVPDVDLWSVESPALYDVEVVLRCDNEVDRIFTYVGFRSIGIDDGYVTINGRKIYQRLVLNQGFWAGGYYTAPTDDDYRRDIEIAQQMGFNGCRMHTKIEDPRFYYWADRLGFLVWEELASPYEFTVASREQIARDTGEMIARDAGHPSVIVWTLYNESWGTPDIGTARDQQDFVRQLVEKTRLLDPSRLVVANDGWEIVGGDIYGIHSYASQPEALSSDLAAFFPRENAEILPTRSHIPSSGKRLAVVDGLPTNRVYIVTEFGGTGFLAGDRDDAWGYDALASDTEELRNRIKSLVDIVRRHDRYSGFVYTQLTDVEQEVNGLLTIDRTPKIAVEEIRRIIAG